MKKSAKSALTSDHIDLRPDPLTAERVLDAGYAQLAADPDYRAYAEAARTNRAARRSAFDAERTATLTEATNPDFIDEDRDWDQTAADGIH